MARGEKATRKSRAIQPPKGYDSIRSFRKDVAKLRKAGVVSKRVNAATQAPTKYMQGKLRKFGDVLRNEVIAVKASPAVRKQYVDAALFEVRGSRIIVPVEKRGMRAKIAKGKYIQTDTPLANGEFRRIILPLKATDLPGFIRYLRDNPDVDGLKQPDDRFNFRLYGHNSHATTGFIDATEMADYVENRYQYLFRGASSQDAFKHLEIGSFRYYMPEAPADGMIYNRGAVSPADRPRGKPGPKPKLEKKAKVSRYKKVAQLETFERERRRENDRQKKARAAKKLTDKERGEKRQRNTEAKRESRERLKKPPTK